jgi:hypothetical protein
MDTPTDEPVSLTDEPVSPLSAPAAGSSVSSPLESDGVPALSTLPGSAPLSLILGGFLALLVSVWAAIVPFVGPSFGFSPDGAAGRTRDARERLRVFAFQRIEPDIGVS